MPINERLAIAQITIYIDILATELPERRRVLEGILEAVLSPVVHVRVVKVHLARDDHVDVLQEGQVKRRRDPVDLVEDDGAAVVAVLKGLKDARRSVLAWVAAGLNVAEAVAVSRQ